MPCRAASSRPGESFRGCATPALEGQRARWILLDLEPERPLLIMITARDDLFDELLAEAMPIVESFVFE